MRLTEPFNIHFRKAETEVELFLQLKNINEYDIALYTKRCVIKNLNFWVVILMIHVGRQDIYFKIRCVCTEGKGVWS